MGLFTPSSSALVRGYLLKHSWATTPSGSTRSAASQMKNSKWPWKHEQRGNNLMCRFLCTEAAHSGSSSSVWAPELATQLYTLGQAALNGAMNAQTNALEVCNPEND